MEEAQPPSAPAASDAPATTTTTTAATATTAAPPAPSQSPIEIQAPSSANPSANPPAKAPANPPVNSPINSPPNSATHYPNGLPRSINGLNDNAINGLGLTPMRGGSASPRTPVQPIAPSPSATTPVLAARAVTAASAPPPQVPAPAPARAPAPNPPRPLKPMVIYTPSQPHPHSQPRQQQHHHQQHQHQQPIHRQSSTGGMHKVSIVEPPRAYSQPRSNPQAPNVPPSAGFPSPRREHHLENSKFGDDLSRLTHAMQQSVPAAVRRVIRDNWEKCLLGSEFHHAFLLNAVIHHSNGVIIRRSIKDFGAKMVSESKHEIVSHFSTADLNELADGILEKASDYFLDLALERRLRTIDARSLINALARAERLGYENSDILDDRRGNGSRFNPAPFNPAPNPVAITPISRQQHTPAMPAMPAPTQAVARPPPPPPPTILQCPLCWRKFDHPQPYEYHVQKQVCTKEPPSKEGFPFSCQYCGAGFITKVGQQYHVANHVCGDHGTMPATPRGPANVGSPITISSGNNSPIQLPSSVPYPPGTQHATTPLSHRSTAASTPGSLPKEQDPYSRLNPATRERLEEELRQAEITYTARFKEAEQIQDPAQRQLKMDGLQNSFSTKQSIIRKKYGVRLRNRRTKAEIDNERQRMGWKHGSPGPIEDTPSAKRQRTDEGLSRLNSQVPPSNNYPEPRSNHIPVADMSGGLGGTNATAATIDPTRPKSPEEQQGSPQNSLTSLQRKGYRISSHLPRSSQVSPADTTMEDSTTQRSDSASVPVVIDEDESSDSDSDGDIPASLPPHRASNTPSRGLAA
ncbi:uncharacterized protein F4812DRAFT_457577 [Daldinia caldariorum]|uniref:uncharacterized protein n=1 Tax=Daldinia caldariorum TaxID=326644 RepID=UPI0020077444|nr:uncharacterized protein F4812DRAFT_457577 [Daldinia caldariorum]KAI1470185.1 hypothetical protein F4812DRAFT_457577 [Daldinia caldariorum]